jgi:TolB protein
VAVIGLLAFGALTVIQGQLPGSNVLSEIRSISPGNLGNESLVTTIIETPLPLTDVILVPTAPHFILRDTLPQITPLPAQVVEPDNSIPVPTVTPAGVETIPPPETQVQVSSAAKKTPTGTIGFSFFNPAASRQLYEIHLINADGTNHRLFPLDGVSEPALHSTASQYQLVFRAWGEQTSPRSLLSSNLDGEQKHRIGGFWEDAQPDWSPIEDRIIFASQRESDRRWRLYTAWADGNAEVNLRREGKSPTFAPDGNRFAFESCDNTGNRCGLWVGDLENSENGSEPFLQDPRAKSPDWSPMDEQVAYMAEVEGNWDLYLINSDGTGIRRLTNDPSIDGLPTWSPNGEWLAFLSNREANWGIWLLQVDTGKTHRLFDFDGGVFTPPNRAPYGDRNWWDEQLSWSN